MSDTPNKEDELAGTEQPFVAHLVELRDRLIRAIVAIAIVAGVLFLYPGPAALYDILAAPDSALVRMPLRALYQMGVAPCLMRHFFRGCLYSG